MGVGAELQGQDLDGSYQQKDLPLPAGLEWNNEPKLLAEPWGEWGLPFRGELLLLGCHFVPSRVPLRTYRGWSASHLHFSGACDRPLSQLPSPSQGAQTEGGKSAGPSLR